jgi:predicted phosphodiesterase
MEKQYLRRKNELDIEYLLRLVGIKLDEKPSDLEWQDIVEFTDLNCHYDSLRKAMQPDIYGAYAIYKYLMESGMDSDSLSKLDEKIKETKIEIQKLRDLRSGYNEKEIRGVARKEALLEEIRYYIKDLQPVNVPDYQPLQESEIVGLFGVADAHYGKELYIEGFNGEPLNVYNPEIFEQRMWRLLNEYVAIIEEKKIKEIKFFELSDSIEGILRISGLQHIKYGITQSSIKYAHFMGEWLNELSKYVIVDYYACLGNHCEIRPLGSKSGDFPKENMQYVIDELLSLILINNDRVTINPTKALQYVDVGGMKVLAAHGQEEKNLINSVKDYKDIFQIDIDLMISGHLHNSKQETASLHTKVVQFPSIVGIDSFSMKLKKTAKAEGKVILRENNRFTNIDIEV